DQAGAAAGQVGAQPDRRRKKTHSGPFRGASRPFDRRGSRSASRFQHRLGDDERCAGRGASAPRHRVLLRQSALPRAAGAKTHRNVRARMVHGIDWSSASVRTSSGRDWQTTTEQTIAHGTCRRFRIGVTMLGPMVDERPIRERWLIVRGELDERGRRMWAAAEARSHGRGGIAAVVRATGISAATVRRGIAEVDSGQRAPEGRVRRPGAGRPSISEREPGLREALLALLEGATRGDPQSPLLWTSRSVANLTAALRSQGFDVHESTVRRQLRGLGFSLQANRKAREGADHPDRDGQFRYIAEVSAAVVAAKEPLISVDTKKQELIGNSKKAGRELAPTGKPILVNTHDFIDEELGKAIPYGIYDVGRDEGWVSVGISADTAQFAVAAINAWWKNLGKQRYPQAKTM